MLLRRPPGWPRALGLRQCCGRVSTLRREPMRGAARRRPVARPGRDPGPRRRIRRGQDDAGARDHAARAAARPHQRRPGHFRRAQSGDARRREPAAQMRGRDMAMVISNPRGELNPLLTVGQQIGNVLRHHLGSAARGRSASALDMLQTVSIPDPERRHRRLSARALAAAWRSAS